jgi:hypothetical protein
MFWNEELRICPKCKSPVQFGEESNRECPKCNQRVWFFNYRALPAPPDLPKPRSQDLFKNPTTTALLVVIALLVLVALVSIHRGAVVAAVCTLVAAGFGVFAFVRHYHSRIIESELEAAQQLSDYASAMRDRARDSVERYNALLRTGDERIEVYFNDIYGRAANERTEAEKLRAEAQRDRDAISNVEARICAMAERLVQDHLKWSAQKLRPDPENYQRRKLELEKAFTFVESVGYKLPRDLRNQALSKLKADYAEVVRQDALKEQQRRINQQMREEQRLQREAQEAIREAETREKELQARLNEELRRHQGVADAQIQELQRQLEEAQARAERAKSMAELTKAGHVYILSNVGSFGDGVFKVGMTRRLEPHDRVRELGDASVPFPFDVHAMISCKNAPALENAIHRELTRHRVNRINLRKEFFRVELATILDLVRSHHGEVEYVADPIALEYRDSLNMSPEQLVEMESELEQLGIVFEEADE